MIYQSFNDPRYNFIGNPGYKTTESKHYRHKSPVIDLTGFMRLLLLTLQLLQVVLNTYGCLLFEGSASIKEVLERLGHTDIKTTMNLFIHT